jgi:hypothetical protein
MALLTSHIITYIRNKEEETKDECNTDIREVINIINIIDKNFSINTRPSPLIKELRNYIVKKYLTSDSSLFLDKVEDVGKIFKIDISNPKIIEEKTQEDIDFEKTVLSLQLLRFNFKEVKIPDYSRELINKVNKLGSSYRCKNLYDKLVNLHTNFDYFKENIKNNINIDDEDVRMYKQDYNNLYDCLQDDKELLNLFFPLGKHSSFSFDNITKEHFAFSFENGLTYYNIYPEAPSSINMNKYNNANNVYIIDKKGIMKVKTNKSNSKIHINKDTINKSNTKEYTDGTKLSYYRF